jgi:glycosyltransferase involved in cell wall biosynthesis
MPVVILLASFNGSAHLRDQLASIAGQRHGDWQLLISDDGSFDNTRQIAAEFATRRPSGQVKLIDGPGAGSTRNFRSLIARPETQGHPLAFCDQDDVWLDTHLTRALKVLTESRQKKGRAVQLYGARTITTDASLHPLGLSPLFGRRTSFRNALVQSIAGGNTMLLSAEAGALLKAASPEHEVVAHDWYAYQVIAGAGGDVVYDPEPTVLYRQHGTNLIGSNNSVRAQVRRLRAVCAGDFHRWNLLNLAALQNCRHLLNAENRAILAQMQRLQGKVGWRALRDLRRAGLYRQTLVGDLSLKFAAAIGKI